MLKYLVPNAMTFSKTGLAGEIKPEWADFVKEIGPRSRPATRRFRCRISSSKVKAHADGLEAARKAAMDPAKAASDAAAKAVKEKAKAVANANTEVTTSISDALAGNHLNVEQVMGIMEHVAKAHGASMPQSFGFDPSNLSQDECKMIAGIMFAAGKLVEMRYFRDQLDVLIKKAENAMIQSKAS